MDYFSLNEEQKLPVNDTEGVVLVLAGAGSGKTRVLTARIAHLVGDLGVSPSEILAITFTNKAAGEMRERLFSMTDVEGMWVSTIHSMCVRILRTFPGKMGLNENFSIYGEQERAAVIKQSFKESGYDEEDLLKTIKWHIGNAKMLGLTPEDYRENNPRERYIDEIFSVYRRYAEHLSSNNALDFDDLLIKARDLLSNDEEAREYFSGKFRYIHVDEFQDTNAVQFEIIRLLSEKHGNLFAVGDDDQSIYGWRGAQIENILHFERSYPKAKIYKLQQNYRSTKCILDLANASIGHNSLRKQKKLWTENDEGDRPVFYEADEEAGEALFCARTISECMRRGYNFSDFAILMRINALTRSFEQEFTKYQIPYKIFGGFKFYERKEIKDTLAYLRIVANPFDDEAILRIINVPRRGIGEKTIASLQEFAVREGVTLFEAISRVKELSLTEGTKQKIGAFYEFMRSLVIKSQEEEPDKLTEYLLRESGMYDMYLDGTDDGMAKRANLDELLSSVQEFVRLNPGSTLPDYLQQVTLYSDTDDMSDGDYVTIATIHAVKGLEFRAVFLIGLEERIMPSSRSMESPASMEEERRLMYVAITRAKERLFLTRSKSRFLYGRRESTARSQFIEELREQLNLPASPRSFSGMGAPRERSFGFSYGAPRRVGSAREYESGERVTPQERPGQNARNNWRTQSAQSTGFGNVGAVREPPKEKDMSKFSVGVRVRHPRFGEGVITAMRGSMQNLIVTVRFEQAGNKDLAAVLAPLEIIG